MNMKVHYRRLLFTHILAKMDDDSTALEIDKSFNVLNVCEMIAAAVKSISVQTTQRCFRKAGVSSLTDATPADDHDDEDGITLRQLIHI